MFTASYRLTGPLLRRSYFRELWRTQGGWLLSVPLALGVAIWSSFDPDYRWFGGFLAGASLSYIGLLYSSYRGAQRYRLDRVVNTTITDGGLHFDFASAASDIPWSSISSVRQTARSIQPAVTMTARRLEPTGAYQGPIWGTLPGAFPTEQAERVYRSLLEQMPSDSIPRDLMGYGFQGVAYRFRAASDYGAEFEGLIGAPGGAAPPSDDVYRQERALFGFFVSGLACLECFSF